MKKKWAAISFVVLAVALGGMAASKFVANSVSPGEGDSASAVATEGTATFTFTNVATATYPLPAPETVTVTETTPPPATTAPPTTSEPPVTTTQPPTTTSAPPAQNVPAGSNLASLYSSAQPGDVFQLADGAYPAATFTGTKSGLVTFRGSRSAVLADLTFKATNIELAGVTVNNSWSAQKEAANVTVRDVKARGFFIESAQGVSIIGGEESCGVCNYHPQISAEYQSNVPPRNILIDGVLFDNWQSASASQHTECLQIGGGEGIIIRNSTFKRCATVGGGATASIHVSWYGTATITKNVLIENNFIYASGNAFTIQANDFDNFDLKYNSIQGRVVVFNRQGGGTSMDFVGNVLTYAAGGCTAENSGVPINWRFNQMAGGTCGATDKNLPNNFVSATDLHAAASNNNGDPNDFPAKDFDGQARGNPPDAGADER